MEYLHPLTKKHFTVPVNVGQILITVLTLCSGVYGLIFDNPWGCLAGSIYLLVCLALVPMMMRKVQADSMPAFFERYYGAKLRLLFSIVSSFYITLRLVAYIVALCNYTSHLPEVRTYSSILLVIGLAGLVLLFQFRGILWLQVLLFGLLITLLPLFARKMLFFSGGIASSHQWLPGLAKHNLKYTWQDALPLVLLTNVLTGHIFLIEKDRYHLRKAFVVALCLILAGLGLWLFTARQALMLRQTYGWMYHALLFAWYLFLLSHLFYVGGKLLIDGIVPAVHTMHKVKGLIMSTLMLIGWSILTVITAYYLPARALVLSRHLTPLVIAFHLLFFATILGFKPDKKSFYASVIVAVGGYIASIILNLSPGISAGLSLPASILAFGLTHYKKYQGFVFVKRGWRETKAVQAYVRLWRDSLIRLKKFLLFPKYIASLSRESVSVYGSCPFKFSIFFCLAHYLFPLFVVPFHSQQAYTTLTYLQFIGFILNIGLLLYPYWPQLLLSYFPLYWHFTLCYCLPFSTTLMYFLDQGDIAWLVHVAMATLLLARLVNTFVFILLVLLGVSLSLVAGWYIPLAQQGLCSVLGHVDKLYPFLYTYLLAALVGIIFIRRSAEEHGQTQEVLQRFCQKIMHKITNVVGLAKSRATLLSFCQKSMKFLPQKEKEAILIDIDKAPYEMMNESIQLLDEESTMGQVMLKNMTRSIRMTIKPEEFEFYTVASCIRQAIEDHELQYETLPSLKLDLQNDFKFWGDDQALTQVFFNLLENTCIHGSCTCQITISIKGNKIYYRDNGPGIPSLQLPYIFDNFYSTSGSIGMGLSYAQKVLQAFKGDISCESSTEPNGRSYTCFIITLRKAGSVQAKS